MSIVGDNVKKSQSALIVSNLWCALGFVDPTWRGAVMCGVGFVWGCLALKAARDGE